MSKAEAVVWKWPNDARSYESEWGRSEFLNSLPYLSPAWLNALYEGMGQDIRIHAMVENDQIQALAALRRGGRWGVSLAHKPWATAYNVVLRETEGGAPADSGLFENLTRHYHSVRGVCAPGLSMPAFVCRTAERRVWSTLVMDIDDISRCWDQCDRHMRQRVRKARELGVTVADSEDAAAFECLYRLTYERQDLPFSLPAGAIARTVDIACRNGNIQLYLARTDAGEPAAGLVVGWGSRCAYFMLAGSHPELRKTDAVTLLWWTVVEIASTRVSKLDLVGIGTPGIQRFKSSFNPSAVDCVDVLCSAWPLRVARRSGLWLKKMRQSFNRNGGGHSIGCRDKRTSERV